jgi:glutamate synthase domain-containing protein 1/glutamate synthase domain-containing protein 3
MNADPNTIKAILQTRRALKPSQGLDLAAARTQAAEGGCGVIGIACTEQIAGRYLLQALDQMRNRGNGKGGGIAAVGLAASEFGVSQQVLEEDYLLVLAYLDPSCQSEVENKYLTSIFEIDHVRQAPHLADYRQLPRLEVRPPQVVQYFVRVKEQIYRDFLAQHPLDLPRRQVEDEIVYQNTFRLNSEFYSSTGETRAFVLSHGKNLLVLKMVGYGDDVVRYYRLENVHAHVWIGHHRYPTKGRVWHPGGAHPFVGLNEALVHNGDFANYASIAEYLSQRNIYPLFLTDTEVSVQVFDLLYRIYGYPLEYVIETLAPTTERDFALLPPDRQRIYDMLQATHMHSSPDGPWFFLIAQSDARNGAPLYRLTGITDTSMLRPQVFALQQAGFEGSEGPAIGFAASEKQAIDAALGALAADDNRFWRRADRYWNARGGSHTDGGAFMFTIQPQPQGPACLVCTDKFGRRITSAAFQPAYQAGVARKAGEDRDLPVALPSQELTSLELFRWVTTKLPTWTYQTLQSFLAQLEFAAWEDAGRLRAFETLALLMDRRYPTGKLRRSSLLALYDESLERIVDLVRESPSHGYLYSSAAQRYPRRAETCQTVVVDCAGFDPEGPNSAALEIVRLHRLGFRKFILARTAGHRFLGNALGPNGDHARIEIFGSSGDYLGSGIDEVEMVVHGSGQDQLGQIMKSGKLVIYGDVGQTFGYAAKGGQVYILGNAAGRPMINAVGKPRVVINGTCLDYLAESFMAGDPHANGGFVVLNGIHLNDQGQLEELDSPYPGGNLFSLASGGAIFIRDPHLMVTTEQLNGGEFAPFQERDWALIEPYLQENERLFGISVAGLLNIDGVPRPPEAVYRKILPARLRALQAEEAWVRRH